MNIKGSAHLTKEDRRTIRDSLAQGLKLKEIAALLGKDERTVSKEIMRRRTPKSNGRVAFALDKSAACKRLMRFPFVCNGCPKRRAGCVFARQFVYDPEAAQSQYESLLSSCRQGYSMTEEEKSAFDAALKAGVDKGQSPYHIAKSNPDAIKVSLRTVYRMIDAGDTPVKSIDLRRKVKLKPRKKHKRRDEIDTKVREGRRYEDFVRFYAQSGAMGIMELDTVEGPLGKSRKCLLTIHSTACHLMVAVLLPSRGKAEVGKAIESIKSAVGDEAFARAFAITLTDRGTEFLDPDPIEVVGGERRCRLFYCDSYSSYQKGSIEENHTLVRYVIPKGTDLDALTDEDVKSMMDNVNSYERKAIGTTPYRMAEALFGKDFLEALGIDEVDPKEVKLLPSLIAKTK